jgi:hypothetical protein
VFILEHHFTSKSFAALHEALSNTCAAKELTNKITVNRQETEFLSVCLFVCLFVCSLFNDAFFSDSKYVSPDEGVINE